MHRTKRKKVEKAFFEYYIVKSGKIAFFEILLTIIVFILFLEFLITSPLYAIILFTIFYILFFLLYRKRKGKIIQIPKLDFSKFGKESLIKDKSQAKMLKKKYFKKLGLGVKILGSESESREMINFAIKKITDEKRRERGRRKIKSGYVVVDYGLPRGKFFPVALTATLKKAAVNKNFPRITPQDLRMKLFGGKGRISLIIVLDTSASMSLSIKGIIDSFEAIKKEAIRFRDRVSLIVCKGFRAFILQHPTTNFNRILSKLKEVGLSDFTPLAEGLHAGLELALLEDRRKYTPIIVVISDGFVNVPCTKKLTREYITLGQDPAVESLVQVAKTIARKKIKTIVINTRHISREISMGFEIPRTGTEVMQNLANITNGMYIGIKMKR